MRTHDGFLYKYKAMDNKGWVQKIFTDNELYFSSKDQFNDPFDCKFGLSLDASEQEVKEYLRGQLDKNRPNYSNEQKENWFNRKWKDYERCKSQFLKRFRKDVEEMISKIGICSLTRVRDNILMWSHYADSHKGFCIRLRDDETDRFIAQAQPISYSKKYPIVNPIRDDKDTKLRNSLLTKAAHWEYEEEWRILDRGEMPNISRKFSPHLLTGVIFGCRMSEADKDLIRKWCANRQTEVSFYQAREASGTYSLKIIEV